ncbi:MAG: hypothetical protein H5T92_04650, partial [Synergistales bacterium]|nr:hypothetical protein [Synergistales bacterium]
MNWAGRQVRVGWTVGACWLAIALGAVVCASEGAATSNQVPSEENQWQGELMAGGPCCGIYSLYACLRAIGWVGDISELLKVEYIGSPRGSSMQELIRATEDQGFFALPVEGLGADALREAPFPALLHVRGRMRGREYDHWVAYLGEQEGKARIVDPPSPCELVSFADLLARWDGK